MNNLKKYALTGAGLALATGAMAQGSVPAEVQTVVDNVNATTAVVFAAIGVAVAFVVGIRWARRIK